MIVHLFHNLSGCQLRLMIVRCLSSNDRCLFNSVIGCFVKMHSFC